MEVEIQMTKKHAKQMLAAALAAGDEVVIQLTKDRLTFHQMDPSQISMSVFDAPSSWFASYEVKLSEGKESELVMIDVMKLDRFVSKAGEMLTLAIRGNKIAGESLSEGVMKKFEMGTIDNNGSSTLAKEPTIKTTNAVTMKKAMFKDVVNETCAMSGASHVRLEVKKNEFNVHAVGDNATSSMKLDRTNDLQFEGEGEFSVCFPASYVTDLLGGMGDKINVNLGKSMPMVIRDASEKNITTPAIVAYLAPQIEDEDEKPKPAPKERKKKQEPDEEPGEVEEEGD